MRRLACRGLCDRIEGRMTNSAQPCDEELPTLVSEKVVRRAASCQERRVDD